MVRKDELSDIFLSRRLLDQSPKLRIAKVRVIRLRQGVRRVSLPVLEDVRSPFFD